MGVHCKSTVHQLLSSNQQNININMKTAIYFAVAMVAVATASPVNYAPGPVSAPLVVGPAKPYSYAYEVVDPVASGNAFGHRKPLMELVPLLENTELFYPIPELNLSNIPFLLNLDTLRKCHTQAHPFTAQLHKSNLPLSPISKHPQAPSEQD